MTTRTAAVSLFVLFACSAAQGQQAVLRFWGDYIKNVDNCVDDASAPSPCVSKGSRVYRNGESPAWSTFPGIDLDNDGELDDNRIVFDFSLDRQLNPQQFDNNHPDFEYRVDKHGGTFYGGIQAQYYNDDIFRDFRANIHQAFVQYEGADFNRLSSGGPDGPLRSGNPESTERGAINNEYYEQYSEITLFTVQPSDHADGELSTFQAAFIWKSEDFLRVGPDDRVFFDDDSQILITTTRKWWNIEEERFVVQDYDGTFYVSEDWDGQVDFRGHDVAFNPNDLEWAVWDPLADTFDFGFDASAATFAPHTFTDVEAVGLYVAQNTPSLSDFANDGTKITFDRFEVIATVESQNAEVVGHVPGDVNGDGIVAMDDYLQLQWETGASVGLGRFGADINGDGFVDGSDDAMWLQIFQSQVPEPTGMALVAVGFVALLGAGRRSAI